MLLKLELVYGSKQGVVVRSPNRLLQECSAVPKRQTDTSFKIKINSYLALSCAAHPNNRVKVLLLCRSPD